jgi:hypothetical protein
MGVMIEATKAADTTGPQNGSRSTADMAQHFIAQPNTQEVQSLPD